MAWANMKARCNNRNNPQFKNYGGRGISYCHIWENFEAFYRDMGKAPKGLTLERIDNNGNYSKDNCKWATQSEQMNNTRRGERVTINGETMTIKKWAERLNINEQTVRTRIWKKGMSAKDALLIPVNCVVSTLTRPPKSIG